MFMLRLLTESPDL